MARKYYLEMEMKRHGVSRKDLATALGLSSVSIQKKITGEVEFKCDEMFLAKKRIGTDATLDELFS